MQQDQIYRLSRKNLLEFNSSENISLVNGRVRDPRTEMLARADQAIRSGPDLDQGLWIPESSHDFGQSTRLDNPLK